MPTPRNKMTDHYGTKTLQIWTNPKIALSQCSVKLQMSLQHQCDSQIQNKQKKTETTTTTTTKAFSFTKASCCNVQTQLKPKLDFTRKPPPIKNIPFKMCCQKSTHTLKTKSPPKLVCLLVTVGNQFVCYCRMLRTDSRWRILSSSSAFLKNFFMEAAHLSFWKTNCVCNYSECAATWSSSRSCVRVEVAVLSCPS